MFREGKRVLEKFNCVLNYSHVKYEHDIENHGFEFPIIANTNIYCDTSNCISHDVSYYL